MHGNNIGEDGCEKLARALRQQKTLLRLNLNGNPLTDKGGVAIAQSLAVRILMNCISFSFKNELFVIESLIVILECIQAPELTLISNSTHIFLS